MSDPAGKPAPSANDFDPDLPSNRMIFAIRRDNSVWPHFLERMEELMTQYGLGEEEKQAFRDVDVKRLGRLGVHPYFLPQVTRLFHGAAGNTTRSAAALAYRKSFGNDIVEHRPEEASEAGSPAPHAEVAAAGGPRSTHDRGASFEASLREAPQDEDVGGSAKA